MSVCVNCSTDRNKSEAIKTPKYASLFQQSQVWPTRLRFLRLLKAKSVYFTARHRLTFVCLIWYTRPPILKAGRQMAAYVECASVCECVVIPQRQTGHIQFISPFSSTLANTSGTQPGFHWSLLTTALFSNQTLTLRAKILSCKLYSSLSTNFSQQHPCWVHQPAHWPPKLI